MCIIMLCVIIKLIVKMLCYELWEVGTTNYHATLIKLNAEIAVFIIKMCDRIIINIVLNTLMAKQVHMHMPENSKGIL